MAPKVLVLSLPRTGTQSIADALQILGYNKIYHMREVEKNGHIERWAELLDAKFGEDPRPLTRADFDVVLEGFDGLADFPASIFADELIAAYPEAKVILTVRDEDAWIASMQSTLVFRHNALDADTSRPMYQVAERYHRYCWHNDFDTYGREYARSFRDTVKRAVSRTNLLEYSVKEGWQPLCTFLECAVPQEPFPRNDELAPYRWKGPGSA